MPGPRGARVDLSEGSSPRARPAEVACEGSAGGSFGTGQTEVPQDDPRRQGGAGQFRAVGTARGKGAISASKAAPPAVTIW